MFYRINQNIPALNTHRLMSGNHANTTKTLERLSSGRKINRASDGPAKLVISEHLKSQVLGVQQAIDNSETAISTIQTAEANVADVNFLLGNIRQLILYALNEGANDEANLMTTQKEIKNLLGSIDHIANSVRFGELKLLDGTYGIFGKATGENLKFIAAGPKTTDSHETGFDVRITKLATKTGSMGTTALTQDIVDAGETLVVVENGKRAEYTAKADDTVKSMLRNFRTEINRKKINVDVDIDEQGRLTAYHKLYGSKPDFQVFSDTSGVLGTVGGELESAKRGEDIRGTINGESAIGDGQYLTGIKGAKAVDGLTVHYTSSESDLEQLYQASGHADGENAADNPGDISRNLYGDGISVGRVYVTQKSIHFHIGNNDRMSAVISLDGVQPNRLGVGIANVSGYESLEDIDVRTYQGALDALTLADASIERLLDLRGDLGAFQKNSLESNLSNLRISNENLTSTESIIRDTDMAAEMTNYTKNQIKNNASTAMYAQANQVPQNVLQLLN